MKLTLRGVIADYAASDTNDEGAPRRNEPAARSGSYKSSDSAGAEPDNGIFSFFRVVEHAPYDTSLFGGTISDTVWGVRLSRNLADGQINLQQPP